MKQGHDDEARRQLCGILQGNISHHAADGIHARHGRLCRPRARLKAACEHAILSLDEDLQAILRLEEELSGVGPFQKRLLYTQACWPRANPADRVYDSRSKPSLDFAVWIP